VFLCGGSVFTSGVVGTTAEATTFDGYMSTISGVSDSPYGLPKKTGQRKQCNKAVLTDNTVCIGELACTRAVIENGKPCDGDGEPKEGVQVVTCDGPAACEDAKIHARSISCGSESKFGDEPCKGAQTSLDGFDISCASQNACEDTTINVMKNGELKCTATHSCGGATISKALTVLNATTFCYGNDGVVGSCAHAKLKTMTLCGVDNDGDNAAADETKACQGSWIYQDSVCVNQYDCKDTSFVRGTICCGLGCKKDADGSTENSANTKKDDSSKTFSTAGEGCTIEVTDKQVDHIPHYVADQKWKGTECMRCGKETLLGFITSSKANMIVAVVVTVLLLLILIGLLVFFILKLRGSRDSTTVIE